MFFVLILVFFSFFFNIYFFPPLFPLQKMSSLTTLKLHIFTCKFEGEFDLFCYVLLTPRVILFSPFFCSPVYSLLFFSSICVFLSVSVFLFCSPTGSFFNCIFMCFTTPPPNHLILIYYIRYFLLFHSSMFSRSCPIYSSSYVI